MCVCEMIYPVLRSGVQIVLDLRFSHSVAPLPIINDRSTLPVHNRSILVAILNPNGRRQPLHYDLCY